MAINPLLALRTQSLDTATPVRNLINMRQQKEQLDIQKSQNERQERMMDLREQQVSADIIQQAYERGEKEDKRRIRNLALGSVQLKRVLEDQGPEAAKQWLQRNQEGNSQLNLPSEDTQEAMEMIESGNIDQLRTGLSNNIYIGESLGLIETPDQPAQFEPVVDDEGNIIGQRNTQTGEVKSDPRAGEQTGQFQTLSAEEASKAGFPEQAVVQRKPSGEFVVKYEPSDRGSDQRDREISDLARDLENQGVPNPRQKATRIVDGRARIEVSEDGRRAVFVDEVALAAGEEDAVSEIQLREPEQGERAEIEPADSLFAMADKATGPQATLRSVTARIPFTNVSEGERETVTARRAFELTENELARGLVNNPRFPVREREAVINAINISPSVFDNPDAMKARLSAARDFLETRLAQAERDAADETLPEDTRNDQAANASAMRNAIDRIGVPAEQTASTIQQIADLDAESARFVVDDMPQAHLREMIANASDEELERIPEIRTWMAERLRENQ